MLALPIIWLDRMTELSSQVLIRVLGHSGSNMDRQVEAALQMTRLDRIAGNPNRR
jgi:hypothetical protein